MLVEVLLSEWPGRQRLAGRGAGMKGFSDRIGSSVASGCGVAGGSGRVSTDVEAHWAGGAGVAPGKMVYGAINMTALLIAHVVHWSIALFLSSTVDLGMCTGLWGERVLHRYGARDGW